MSNPHRVLTGAAALVVLLLAPTVQGAADKIPLGRGHVAELDGRGVVRITRGNTEVIRELFIGTWVDGTFADQLKAIKLESGELGGMLTRRGVIPRPGASSAFQVFARATPPGPDGLCDLVLSYVVETPQFPKAKAAVLCRLPIVEFATKGVTVDKEPVGVFPEKQTNKPTLAMKKRVHDLAITSGKQHVLFIGRSDPGDVLVQDARKWGAKSYEAQFHLMPSRSQPGERRTLDLLISLADVRGPTVARLATSPPSAERSPLGVPRYGRLELQLDLWARFDNPYQASDIEVSGVLTQPDKTERTVRGFYYQDFERHLSLGREQLTPSGPRGWRLRVTPTQLGPHTLRVRVRTRQGTTQTEPVTFHAVKSKAPGFVSVHKKNPRYFQFSNGKTFFLVGHNVCWGSQKRLSYDIDDYFRRMDHAGETYTRIWMCSWDSGIESRQLDHYRLDAAWRLDYILSLAERRGIRVKLCFDNSHDYINADKRKLFGCWKPNGGPCGKVLDFFTLPASKAAYKRRLDYILARWGYSPHVMAWELWNEISYIEPENPDARGTVVAWTEEMARYLKANDPYRHLVTTSLGLLTSWDELWELEDIDFVQIHAYLPQPETARTAEEKDAVLAVLRAGHRAARYGKPYHVAEFGYLDLQGVNRTNEKDPTGIHLHNAIWSSLFSGAAGTPAVWWWKEYVHARNLYKHYASAAGFMHDIDPAAKDWTRVVSAGGSKMRVIGLKKRDRCALWIQRRGNTWHRLVTAAAGERKIEPLGPVRLRVSDVAPGTYRITWWDTSAGEITRYPQFAVRRSSDPSKYDLILEKKSNTGVADIAVKAQRIE